MPENMSPTFRVAVGTDPNTQVIGPAVHGRAADYHHIKVFWGAVHNGTASDKAGSPVYDKVLQVRYIYPGSGDYLDVVVKRWPADGGEPVITDPERYNRYREVLEKYEAKADQKAHGTPLAVLNLDPHEIATLNGKQVETIEQLADVPDNYLGNLGLGGRTVRDRARAFMEASAGNAPLAKMQAENDGLRADLDAMRNKVAELAKDREDAKHEAETRRDASSGPVRSEPAQASKPQPAAHRAEPQQHQQQRKA
jgi:hypothetical protein